MKVVWQLIEDADGLQYPARQVQLMTDITNVLVPFGFDCETTIVWDYLKEGTLVNYFCGCPSKSPAEGALVTTCSGAPR